MGSAIAYAHFTMMRYSGMRLAHVNPHNNYILGGFAAGQSHPTIKLREVWPPKSSNDVTDNGYIINTSRRSFMTLATPTATILGEYSYQYI